MVRIGRTKTVLAVTILLGSACSSDASSTSTEATSVGATQIATTVAPAPVLEVVFDASHPSGGLLLQSGGDVDTEVVTAGSSQEQAWRSGNGRVLPSQDGNTDQDWYMQFQVDDQVIHQGSPTSHVQIEIEYLDVGTDAFTIQYDAVDGASGENRFKESEIVAKTDTGEFKTAIFTLQDAYFGNRTNGGDFRISDLSDGSETIRRVTVTVSPTDSELPASTTAAPRDLGEDQAGLVFHNGVVLTMEDGATASAIAIRDQRILGVGSNEDMLALAGPGTELIDLEGRTLMPGFVDPHNHVFDSVWAGNLEAGQAHLLANGTTTSAEMFVENYLIEELKALDQQNNLRMRISLYPVHVDNCGEIRGEWYLPDHPVSREPGAMLQIPGVKLFNDGGSCNVPAVSFDYNGGLGQGDLYFESTELADMIIAIQDSGYQVAVHGLGDRAIESNLDALEIVLAGGDNTFHHRLEHNTLVRDEMLSRYGELDAVAAIFGFFPTCWYLGESDDYRYVIPDEFKEWEWRWRSLIDSNPDAHFAWHSDAPWMGESDPLEHLHGFVTRRQFREDGSVCEPPAWAVDDLLTVEEALEIMTIGPAYALLREDEIGSLKTGKLADLIILSDNPLEIDPDDILDVQVVMTMVGGNTEHCMGGYDNLCPNTAGALSD